MPDIPSLTAEIDRLNRDVGFWNTAIIILMIGVAMVATGLVIAQQMAFRRADALASATAQLSKLKEDEANQKIADALKQAAESNEAAGEANERAGNAQASLAKAEQHSAEANAKAEGFRRDIANANAESAQAEAQVAGATAEAAKATLELAKFEMPRTLSEEQQLRIANKMLPFSGQQFAPFVFADAESKALMELIAAALLSAKWVLAEPKSDLRIGKAGVTSQSGIFIQYLPRGTSGGIDVTARRLAETLNAEGIEATATANPNEKEMTPNAIALIIGSKPIR